MNAQLELPVVSGGIKSQLRNLLILGRSVAIHELLDISLEKAAEAVKAWKRMEIESEELLSRMVDSERKSSLNRQVARFESVLIRTLLYHSQTHE